MVVAGRRKSIGFFIALGIGLISVIILLYVGWFFFGWLWARGKADPMPDSVFWANLTPLDDEALPPRGTVGPGGIVNGLYSIHIRALDGVDAALTGVALLMDGRILGGDAFFYYLGAYSSADGRWKGEILNQEHTPAKGENPIFGGHEVGIGFSGTCSEAGAELEGIALAGKRSLRLAATLKLMRQA